ncbi:hypothetical protein [Tautonia rosea]|uniref:hypothetical protein n=1 Tax=Tautonia rosea TaxID=2728037 RepID=UPI001473CE97|nr:hypothetical protein [Tautonia rosea]
MQLLVSFQHVRPPSRAGLGFLDLGTGRFRIVLELPPTGGRCDGLLGLARSDRMLFVSAAPFRHLGEAEPSLLVFRAEDLMPEARYQVTGFSDLTDLEYHEGTLYVLSSGTGQMIAFRADRGLIDPAERFLWRPRLAVEGKADPALHALTFFRNELYVSASDRASFDAFLFNVTRDSVAARTLQDPESLAVVGNTLCYAAGRFGAVHQLGADLALQRSAGIEGHVQGLCEADGSLFAASTNQGRCVIHRLKADDLSLEASIPIDVDGVEVACMLPIEGAGAWPDPPEPIWFEMFGERI